MPMIYFELKDNRYCEGCPLDQEGPKCRAGFLREFSHFNLERQEQCHQGIGGIHFHDHAEVYRNRLIRPQVCILTTEPKAKIAGTLTAIKPQAEAPATEKTERSQ